MFDKKLRRVTDVASQNLLLVELSDNDLAVVTGGHGKKHHHKKRHHKHHRDCHHHHHGWDWGRHWD